MIFKSENNPKLREDSKKRMMDLRKPSSGCCFLDDDVFGLARIIVLPIFSFHFVSQLSTFFFFKFILLFNNFLLSSQPLFFSIFLISQIVEIFFFSNLLPQVEIFVLLYSDNFEHI